jgi:hypothetical protein
MKSLNTLEDYLAYNIRNREGREIQADAYHSASYAGIEVRLWNKQTNQILRVVLSYRSIEEGSWKKTVDKMFDTYPLNKLTKLELILK